jgi:hypothetical protein
MTIAHLYAFHKADIMEQEGSFMGLQVQVSFHQSAILAVTQ